MKVADMTGALLDYWVGKAEGLTVRLSAASDTAILSRTTGGPLPRVYFDSYAPSTRWNEGGPIFERERIEVSPAERYSRTKAGWQASLLIGEQDKEALYADGPTPLIAAMRCFVASRFGMEVSE
jgi:hypothetical protein